MSFRILTLVFLLFPFLASAKDEIRGFVSVEPFELRLEAVVKIEPFRELWRLKGEEIAVTDRQAILSNIETLFGSGVNLSSPGKTIQFTSRSVRFIALDPDLGYVADERETIAIKDALVGITLSANVEGVEELEGEWLWFASGQKELVVEIASRGRPAARLLTLEQKKFTWKLDEGVEAPERSVVPAVERAMSRPMQHFIWVGLAILAVAGCIVIRHKQRSPSWVGWLIVLGIGLGIASFQVKIDRVMELTADEDEQLIGSSLRNIYHAFNYRDEGAIYDSLEKTIEGPLLERVYLEIRKSLAVEGMGGPRVKVYEVVLSEWEKNAPNRRAEKDTSELNFRVKWATIGEVTHWGHTHERTNRYEADMVFSAGRQDWKVVDLALLNEERVKKVSRREVVPTSEPEAEKKEEGEKDASEAKAP